MEGGGHHPEDTELGEHLLPDICHNPSRAGTSPTARNGEKHSEPAGGRGGRFMR